MSSFPLYFLLDCPKMLNLYQGFAIFSGATVLRAEHSQAVVLFKLINLSRAKIRMTDVF